jgi:hypothetical protein
MLKKPIWSATETTLFYYSGDSTTGQVGSLCLLVSVIALHFHEFFFNTDN